MYCIALVIIMENAAAENPDQHGHKEPVMKAKIPGVVKFGYTDYQVSCCCCIYYLLIHICLRF